MFIEFFMLQLSLFLKENSDQKEQEYSLLNISFNNTFTFVLVTLINLYLIPKIFCDSLSNLVVLWLLILPIVIILMCFKSVAGTTENEESYSLHWIALKIYVPALEFSLILFPSIHLIVE